MKEIKICVLGLGYVGLPLARLFSTKFQTIGFDINKDRVNDIMNGVDSTNEVSTIDLQHALESGFKCTSNISDIKDCNYYIITVPTPVTSNNIPNLHPLYNASAMVGKVLSHNDIVIYESTVYPGVTENECVPVLEKVSGLTMNKDFFVGYSPERINPSDKINTVENIRKVVSGSNIKTTKDIEYIYNKIIKAGVYVAESIKVAEASKVIENAQRDVNIAFVNELAIIFNKMGINTHAVLEAAATKWNFLSFKPGLVGGHCIGVDPYYLIQCAQNYGYNPELIKASRKINNSMGEYVGNEVIKLMIKKGISVLNSKILILGYSFKENCPDIRNTRVDDIVDTFNEYDIQTTIYDPYINDKDAESNHIHNKYIPRFVKYDAIILAVAHNQFNELNINELKNETCVVYDIKNMLNNADQYL